MLANNPSIYADHQRAYKGGAPILDQKELEAPLHLRKPARIGLQFMGDLFYGQIKREWVSKIFDIIYRSPQHNFFVLTKRPKQAEEFFRLWEPSATELVNLWLGVSIEDQPTADERIPILLQIPAAHYWISHEPGLGKVIYPKDFLTLGKNAFLVTGGETGSRARPMHPDIPSHDRDQCHISGVKYFFKSWGEWIVDYEHPTHIVMRDGIFEPINRGNCCSGVAIRRIGHKNSGRLLDGREWNEMP